MSPLILAIVALAQGASEGEVLYRAKCAACHDDRGWASAVIGRGQAGGAGTLTSRKLPADYTRAVIRQGRGTMPGFAPTEITDAQAQAIAAWLER